MNGQGLPGGLTAEQRTAVLTKAAAGESDPKTPAEKAFKWAKEQTARAYYTSKIGIHEEMEYKGNTLLVEFVGEDPALKPRRGRIAFGRRSPGSRAARVSAQLSATAAGPTTYKIDGSTPPTADRESVAPLARAGRRRARWGRPSRQPPKLTIYRAPRDKANGRPVVICSGGGYCGVALRPRRPAGGGVAQRPRGVVPSSCSTAWRRATTHPPGSTRMRAMRRRAGVAVWSEVAWGQWSLDRGWRPRGRVRRRSTATWAASPWPSIPATSRAART